GGPGSRHDDPTVEEIVGDRDTRLENAAWIVSQVEHESLQSAWIVSFEAANGPADVRRCGLAEGGNAEVAVARLEGLLHDAVHLDLGPAKGVVRERLAAGAPDREAHEAPGGPPHAGDGAGAVGADLVCVVVVAIIPRQGDGPLRGRSS